MTHVFSEILKRRFAWILIKKKRLFWGVNRWEKDINALVVDSADYDMVRSLQVLNNQKEKFVGLKVSKWKLT